MFKLFNPFRFQHLRAVILMIGFPALIHAAPLVTDRPDFTESVELIPLKATQVEAGYTYSNNGTATNTFGEILVRRSLEPNLELRVGLPSLTYIDRDASGLGNASIGVKLKVDTQSSWLIGTGLPVGSDAIREDALNPFVKYLWATPLTSKLLFSTNVGLQQVGDESDQFIQWVGTASLGMDIMPSLGGYVEYYALSPSHKRGSFLGYVNGGLTYQFSDDLQADVRVGSSLDKNTFYIGTGISARFWD